MDYSSRFQVPSFREHDNTPFIWISFFKRKFQLLSDQVNPSITLHDEIDERWS